MKIRAISFDLEGPLVNMEPLHHGGHVAAAQDVGLTLTIEECFAKVPHFIGGPDEKIAEEIAVLASADGKYVLARTNFHYKRLLGESEVLLRPGVREVVSEFIKMGIPVSIGSAVDTAHGKFLVAKTGLDNLFPQERILFAEDVLHTKPAPDIYLATAQRMGVRPEEQLVFEDSPWGALAASATGSVVVGMPIYWNHHTVAELIKSGAKRVFLDWREINIDQLLINLERES
jgi:beta-phosphoglucomutase